MSVIWFVLSRASVETDSLVYFLSCLDDEIRRSALVGVHGNVRACLYMCGHRAMDKLSFVLLNLTNIWEHVRVLMLIPMVNSPEMPHRRLIRPLSIIYTKHIFGYTNTHTHAHECACVWESDSCWHMADLCRCNISSLWETSSPEHFPSVRQHTLNWYTAHTFSFWSGLRYSKRQNNHIHALTFQALI